MSHATDGHGTPARATETKFVVDPVLGEAIRAWARGHLTPDPHGAGTFDDQYRTASVYFDTDEYDVFYRRGSFARSKYRVRRYGRTDVVFLERKLARPGLVAKRRTEIPFDAFARAGQPGSAADGAAADASRTPGRWFHRRLEARRLKPVCQVSYLRTARIGMTGRGPVRLTLDEDVRALPADELTFSGQVGTPVLAAGIIVELKYSGEMPHEFLALVEQFGLVPRPASKYRLSVVALGYAPPSALRSVVETA